MAARPDFSASLSTSGATVSTTTILRWLLPYIWQHRLRTAVAVALLLVSKGATVATPLLLKHVVDALTPLAGATAELRPALAAAAWATAGAGLLLYGLLRAVTGWARELENVVYSRVEHAIVRDISVKTLAHLHALSLRYHLERKTGAVTRDIGRGTSSVSSLLGFLLFNIVPTLVELAMVVGVLLSGYAWTFSAVVLVTFVVYVAYTLRVTQWRIPIRAVMNEKDSEAQQQAIDGLVNYETVKYFTNEPHEIGRYEQAQRAWEVAANRTETSLSVLNAGQGTIITLGVTAMMLLAARGVSDGSMTVGDLVALNAFLVQLFIPLGFLGAIYSMLKSASADLERLFGLLAKVPEIQDRAEAGPLRVQGGAVRFEDVHFGYDADRGILKGVTFEIPAGRTVAVVGQSGAGKSTLARLLFRFYDVSAGEVRIDGQPVSSVTQRSLRAAIGIVPQDTVLFNDTLFANIAYGRLDATRQEVLEAVRAAQLDGFVASLPKGLDTMVGERGLKLSGGEKQRVAIARAILKNPPILVFDEATSSLDLETERHILDALDAAARDRTTLVIAHRLSTVAHADRIIVLQQGVVVEQGTHTDLIAAGGVYAGLWRLQEDAEPRPA